MRCHSQGKLRGLCLILPIFGALACGDEPSAPAGQASAGPPPDWAQQLCQSWRRRDGSCDQATLVADYGDCLSSKGVPELERLRKAGVGNRMRLLGQIQATNLCLELRHWVLTEEGRRSQLGGEKQRAKPS